MSGGENSLIVNFKDTQEVQSIGNKLCIAAHAIAIDLDVCQNINKEAVNIAGNKIVVCSTGKLTAMASLFKIELESQARRTESIMKRLDSAGTLASETLCQGKCQILF